MGHCHRPSNNERLLDHKVCREAVCITIERSQSTVRSRSCCLFENLTPWRMPNDTHRRASEGQTPRGTWCLSPPARPWEDELVQQQSISQKYSSRQKAVALHFCMTKVAAGVAIVVACNPRWCGLWLHNNNVSQGNKHCIYQEDFQAQPQSVWMIVHQKRKSMHSLRHTMCILSYLQTQRMLGTQR